MSIDDIVLPSDWSVTQLGNIADIRYGLGQPPTQADDGIPMIRATNIKRGRISADGLLRLDPNGIPARRNPFLKKGDILVVRSGVYTGDVAMVTAAWAGSVAGYDLVVSLRKDVDPTFCSLFLLSDCVQEFFHSQSARSAQPHLNRRQLESTAIAMPPLAEQRKIAAVLISVQDALERQRKWLALAIASKAAVLNTVFAAGLNAEPQHATELGLLPQSWQVVPLGTYLREAQYGLSTKGSASGPIPLLRMTNQRDGRISADNLQYAQLTDGQLARFRLIGGDILFNRTNSHELVGRTALFDLDGEFVFASYLIRLRTVADQLRPQFLNHYLNWDDTQARLKTIAARAVSQSNISATRLRGFVVPIPDVAEQEEIVATIDSLDIAISAHRRKQQLLDDLFRTLLHQLMTAALRVDDLTIPDLDSALAV